MCDPFKMTGVCNLCGEVFETAFPKSSWRFNGETWEHRCEDMHYTMGHAGQLISHELHAARQYIVALKASLAELIAENERDAFYDENLSAVVERARVVLKGDDHV